MAVVVGSSPMFQAPNTFTNILRPNGDGDNLPAHAGGDAGRLYLLAQIMPSMPAWVLLGLARNEITWYASGQDVIIDVNISEDALSSGGAQ